MNALAWNRFQFGFTVTYHYLFPQLTMGLALLILLFKLIALKTKNTLYNDAARFWGRLFGINFAIGVVTGIPMEFQFGTNWARFSSFAGGVVGNTLAMEGMFAFFAESAFLGLFLFGERRFGNKVNLLAAFMVFFGSWLSGYFIIATNAFMQHPVGYGIGPDGRLMLVNFWAFVLNPWAIYEYLHNMCASVVTASFAVAAVGALYLLLGRHQEYGKIFLKMGVIAGLVSSLLQVFPTGDAQGKMLARYQPPALAAMEGAFKTSAHAPLVIIGQPNERTGQIENPITVPDVLSFLAYGSTRAEVRGLDSFPPDQRPDNAIMAYYAYHIMVGLGTIFIVIMGLSALLLWKGRLDTFRPLLWVLLCSFPFPYIATTMGWVAAEMGRQPWVVYGLQRTAHATSPLLSGGDVAFSTLGFTGLYLVIGIVFLYLFCRELAHGPSPLTASGEAVVSEPGAAVTV
jgi:cytochrome d ubiquinol oxidase subunit I